MLDEYLSFFNYYKLQYSKVCVLYHNGKFYEMYGMIAENLGNLSQVADDLALTIARRDNSKPVDRSNFQFAGFQIEQLPWYLEKLTLDFLYTVVIIKQLDDEIDPVTKRIKRVVDQIITPGTNAIATNQPDSNFLVCIYQKILQHRGKKVPLMSFNLSAVDVSTGVTHYFSVCNTSTDEMLAHDDLKRMLLILNPREILLFSNDNLATEHSTSFGFSEDTIRRFNDIPKDYFRPAYQHTFLDQLFPKKSSMLTIVEMLGLERYPDLVVSLLLLFNFCHQQNPTLLKNLKLPTLLEAPSMTPLLMDGSSLSQLNILPSHGNDKKRSLYDLLDECETNMGKRLLKERLTAPICDAAVLEKRYDTIDLFLFKVTTVDGSTTKASLYTEIIPHLRGICDIERLQRKINLKVLSPDEFVKLDESYRSILELIGLLKTYKILYPSLRKLELPAQIEENLREFITYYTGCLDLEECAKNKRTKMVSSFFQQTFHNELDDLFIQEKEIECYFERLIDEWDRKIKAPGAFSLNEDKKGHFLATTVNRWKKLVAQETLALEGFIVEENQNRTKVKIRGGEISKCSTRWEEINKQRNKVLYDQWLTWMEATYDKFSTLFDDLVSMVGYVDYYQNCAKVSQKYKYSRPTICKGDDTPQMKFSQVRHPLKERDQCKEIFTPLDISFCGDEKSKLLFGLNCSGKSVLMKAVAMNLLMAQSGMFVAASTFEYFPYRKIFTRILTEDDLENGKSSFAVEMTDLRSILRRADNHSLVLCDELNKSTEVPSAIAILAATLVFLSKQNTSYLFTTHFHELCDLKVIQNLKQLRCYHLKFSTDPQTGAIIYNRLVESGEGPRLYGLEVARGLGIPKEFIDIATEVRNEYLDTNKDFLERRKSRYNSLVYMGRCAIPGCTKNSTETHHILFQRTTDEQGFVGSRSVLAHTAGNLLPLCEEHHLAIHHQKLVVRGYIQTTEGVKLDYDEK